MAKKIQNLQRIRNLMKLAARACRGGSVIRAHGRLKNMKRKSADRVSVQTVVSPSPGRVSLYRLSLACKAAPGLGCGTRAKPVLLALEGNPAVSEAWINRQGTVIALAWAETFARNLRAGSVLSILKWKGLGARELVGEARDRALKDFLAGGWYRAAAVDKLSEEEAGVIAARLVRRLTAQTNLSDGKAETLRVVFTEACKRELMNNPAASALARRNRIARAILEAGRGHLDDSQFTALKKAIALGHRPLPGEE